MRTPETTADLSSEEMLQLSRLTVNQRYIAPTVEECAAIQVKMFRNREKQWNRAGELGWTSQRSGRVAMVARYIVTGIPGTGRSENCLEKLADEPVLLLVIAGVAQRIRLRPCPGEFGGTRYYFECPCCDRNYRKLFLVPGKSQFACRRCEGLRYTSQRRDLDFFLKPIAAKTGVKRRLVRKYLEEVREIVYRQERMRELGNQQVRDGADDAEVL
jgi:hypothetical protein